MPYAPSLQSEQLSKLVLCQLRTDDAQTSGVVCTTVTDLILTRYEVKVQPRTVNGRQHTLCTQDDTVLLGIA